MSEFTCRICSNSQNNKSYVAKEMMIGLRHEFLYFQCSRCKCLQIDKIPENIHQYYSGEKYYSYKGSTADRFSGLAGFFKLHDQGSSVFNDSLRGRIMNFVNPSKHINVLKGTVASQSARILDVGSGNGFNFLYPIFKAGFKNAAGCDPFIEEDITYTEGLKIYKKQIFQMEGEWDVITFHHSLEHISNPFENLKKAYELLVPDGYCIIRIPTVSSYAWNHYGVDWFQLDAPRHIFLHSIQSMQILASHAGFKMDRIEYDSSHYQFTISERYKSGRAFTERGYKTIFHRVIWFFRKLIYKIKAEKLNRKGMGDQAAFYLQKV